jgi:hypothetical protein
LNTSEVLTQLVVDGSIEVNVFPEVHGQREHENRERIPARIFGREMGGDVDPARNRECVAFDHDANLETHEIGAQW